MDPSQLRALLAAILMQNNEALHMYAGKVVGGGTQAAQGQDVLNKSVANAFAIADTILNHEKAATKPAATLPPAPPAYERSPFES